MGEWSIITIKHHPIPPFPIKHQWVNSTKTFTAAHPWPPEWRDDPVDPGELRCRSSVIHEAWDGKRMKNIKTFTNQSWTYKDSIINIYIYNYKLITHIQINVIDIIAVFKSSLGLQNLPNRTAGEVSTLLNFALLSWEGPVAIWPVFSQLAMKQTKHETRHAISN
jgi:hypothetical protein